MLVDQAVSDGYHSTSVSFFWALLFLNLEVKLFESKSLISYILMMNNHYLLCRPHFRSINSESMGMEPGNVHLLKSFPGGFQCVAKVENYTDLSNK